MNSHHLIVIAPLAGLLLVLGILVWRHHHRTHLWQAHWHCLKCGAHDGITATDRQTAENHIHNSALNHSIEHQYGYVQPKTTADHPPTILIRGPGFEPIPHPHQQGEPR